MTVIVLSYNKVRQYLLFRTGMIVSQPDLSGQTHPEQKSFQKTEKVDNLIPLLREFSSSVPRTTHDNREVSLCGGDFIFRQFLVRAHSAFLIKIEHFIAKSQQRY